jgi:transcriptional antiterminator RfaH
MLYVSVMEQTNTSTELTSMLLRKPIYEWYAIYTKANGEKRLLSNLQEKQIECYLPLRKVLKYWSDRKKWLEEPLFRGYIFAKVSYREFFDVINTQGAVCYVSFGGKAQPIPEIQMNNIKTMVEQTEKEISLSYQNIKRGQQAEVIYGTLKGVQGEIVEILGQDRILIRIESLNCSLHANISRDEVSILSKKSYTTQNTNPSLYKTSLGV